MSDRFFWIALRRFRSGWKQALILVQPETVVGWHRAGFRLYWKWLSRHQRPTGRRCVGKELRELIFRMVAENPTWGAPRIHGTLNDVRCTLSAWRDEYNCERPHSSLDYRTPMEFKLALEGSDPKPKN